MIDTAKKDGVTIDRIKEYFQWLPIPQHLGSVILVKQFGCPAQLELSLLARIILWDERGMKDSNVFLNRAPNCFVAPWW